MGKTIFLNEGPCLQIPIHDAKILSLQYDSDHIILRCRDGLYIGDLSNNEKIYYLTFNVKPEDINVFVSKRKRSFLKKHLYYHSKEISIDDFQRQFRDRIVEVYEIYYGDSHCIILKGMVIINGKYSDKVVLLQFYTSDDSVVEINY